METERDERSREPEDIGPALLARALSGDVEAQMLWLSIRRPDKWSGVVSEETEDGN